MLKNIVNLKGAQELSKNEQKKITAGYVAITKIECECGIIVDHIADCTSRCLGLY